MQVQPMQQQMQPPQVYQPQEVQEPEDPKRQLCRRLSKASYLESVPELVTEAAQSHAAILQTWPAIFEQRGFSAFTAALTVAPGVEVLLVAFRGTVGTPEWLSYPEALAGEPFMTVEGLTGFAPFVDAVHKVMYDGGLHVLKSSSEGSQWEQSRVITPVAQLVPLRLVTFGSWVRNSVKSHDLGFFLTSCLPEESDFTVDEEKRMLNSSRYSK